MILLLGVALVVNCFQITTLVEDSQDTPSVGDQATSCELLSDYYFSRRFTGNHGKFYNRYLL